MTPRTDKVLLAMLPGKVAQAVRRALAGRGASAEKAWSDALAAVTFPAQPQAIPLAEDLSSEQRALAEILARHAGPVLGKWAIPASAWSRRRWLGIDPPGVLERPVAFADGARRRVPLWRALAVLDPRGKAHTNRFFAKLRLPLGDRLEAFGHLVHGAYRPWDAPSLPWGKLSEIKGGEAWARAEAERLLGLFRKGVPRSERAWDQPHEAVRWPLFLSLARGKQSIDPRYDGWLPVATEPAALREATRECLRALPPARREAALLAAAGHGAGAIALALAFFTEVPSDRLMERAIRGCDELTPPRKAQALTQLTALARKHPGAPAPGARAPAPALVAQRVWTPRRAGDLSPLQQRQIVQAGRLYDGKRRSAEDRVTAGGPHALQHLLVHDLRDAGGRPAFDAYTFMGDSGAVFRAGTTKVIAQIIQTGLQCDDVPLREALWSALRRRARRG